jgi:hypothetical protein
MLAKKLIPATRHAYYWIKSKSLLDKGQFSRSYKIYMKIHAPTFKDPKYYLYKALLEHLNYNNDTAIEDINKAISLAPAYSHYNNDEKRYLCLYGTLLKTSILTSTSKDKLLSSSEFMDELDKINQKNISKVLKRFFPI